MSRRPPMIVRDPDVRPVCILVVVLVFFFFERLSTDAAWRAQQVALGRVEAELQEAEAARLDGPSTKTSYGPSYGTSMGSRRTRTGAVRLSRHVEVFSPLVYRSRESPRERETRRALCQIKKMPLLNGL